MSLDDEIRKIARDEVVKTLSDEGVTQYEPLSVEGTAEFCGCGKSTILDLIKDPSSGFPGAQLSPKVFTVNKIALVQWLSNRGILAIQNKEEETETKLRAIK